MKNTIYSHKDYTNQSLKSENVNGFNNTEIHGSQFYQEGVVNADIFPDGMTGVTFINCDLNNVKVPAGNTIDPSCCNKRIQVKNDKEDWECDSNGDPIEPTNKGEFIKFGLSIDPADIPAQEMDKPRTIKKFLGEI